MPSSLSHARKARQPGHAPTAGAGGGHWYAGEPAPGECLTNAPPIDDGRSVAWAPDLQCVQESLLGLLAEEQAEEGWVATAEEEDEEEDWRRSSSMAGDVVPL